MRVIGWKIDKNKGKYDSLVNHNYETKKCRKEHPFIEHVTSKKWRKDTIAHANNKTYEYKARN